MIHHNNVSLRVDRNTERFAEIHVGIDLEEIRNRFKRDQWATIPNRPILVWASLPPPAGRGAISALPAPPPALRKNGKGPCKIAAMKRTPEALNHRFITKSPFVCALCNA